MDEIDAYVSEIEQRLEAFVKAFREEEGKRVEALKASVAQKVGEKQRRVYKRIYRKVIDEFYNDYQVSGYDRIADTDSHSGGLYDVLSIPDSDGYIDYNSIDDLVDPSQFMINRPRSKPYKPGAIVKVVAFAPIFDLVFNKGYHGGAATISAEKAKKWGEHPSPGTPHWRTSGLLPVRDGVRIRHRWARWNGAAYQSASPADRFEEEIQKAEDGEIQEYFMREGLKQCKEVDDAMHALAPSLFNKHYFGKGG